MGRPDIDWLTDTVAIGGSLDAACLGQLVDVHRVAAVIDLRGEACDDAALLARYDIALLHLPTADHHAIAPHDLERGLDFTRFHSRKGKRVLAHCQFGIGRSAMLCLCRLSEEGWPPLEALERLKAARPLASPSPAQYEGWARWLRARGERPPLFGDFAAIAYRTGAPWAGA